MAKNLTPRERAYLSDLRQNFDGHVKKYRGEVDERLKAGEKAELVEELKRMEEYLAIYHQGEVDDLKVNIDFKVAKINVLKDVLQS